MPFASLELFFREAHNSFLIPQCITFSQCLGSHLLEFMRKINGSSTETAAVTDGHIALVSDSLLFNLENVELP